MNKCGSEGYSSPHGITTILFDLDNTLIATREADAAACLKVASWLENRGMSTEKSLSITTDYLHKFRETPAPDYPTNQAGLDQWRYDIWVSVLPPEYEHLDSVYSVWKRERLSHLYLKPCVRQLLDDLGVHFTIGIVTNGPSVAQWEKVKETGVRKFCDSVVISGDYEVEKPDKAIFDIAFAELQVKPCECVMVGDKIESDILGGKNAGVKMTVWLNGRGKVAPNDVLPDFTIDHIKELRAVLFKS
ncbi:N-acylneuraminate-9-phosphatase-like isoform X3 [Portunus trituberculatus]|nr:N-acylneuraminate-9-phosphatase-like isoform X3 [Portunus trituberculatus]